MVVTDITVFDKKRHRIYIDGAYAFPLYNTEIKKYKLNIGDELSRKDYEELREIVIRRIKERIMYLLDAYERTERDLHRKMLAAGYEENTVEAAIGELKEYGFINDLRFAENYAESLRENKGKSLREIRMKLFEKGISKEIIEEVLLSYDEDESELIERAIKKKGINASDIPGMDRNERNRLYMYLSRKGFNSEEIMKYFSGWDE